MTRVSTAIVLLSLAACGFGFGDDLGTPTPPTSYWGWQCADGTAPDPDAGCLPATCSDNSTPALVAGVCTCSDGTPLLSCACQADGCGDG